MNLRFFDTEKLLSFLLVLCCVCAVVRGAPKIISKEYNLMPDGKGGLKTVASFTISCQRPYESVQFTSGNHTLDVFCGSVQHKEQVTFTGYYTPEFTITYSSKVCERYTPRLPLSNGTSSGDDDEDDSDEAASRSKRNEVALAKQRQKRLACDDLDKWVPGLAYFARTQCQDSQTAQMVGNEMSLINKNQQILDTVHDFNQKNQDDIQRLVDNTNKNNQEVQDKFSQLTGQVASSLNSLQSDVNAKFQGMDTTFMNNRIQLLQQVNMYTDDTHGQFQNITGKFTD
jgi:hypothetical protein